MAWDRTVYDRERARELYSDFVARKKALAKAHFGKKCYTCGAIGDSGFHFHHIVYEQGSAYPRHSKAMNVRLKRLKEAEMFPERFKLLCGRCHRIVEGLRCQRNGINLNRL